MQAETYNRSFTEALYFIINFHWSMIGRNIPKKETSSAIRQKGES